MEGTSEWALSSFTKNFVYSIIKEKEKKHLL